jgi:hypothetical protein
MSNRLAPISTSFVREQITYYLIVDSSRGHENKGMRKTGNSILKSSIVPPEFLGFPASKSPAGGMHDPGAALLRYRLYFPRYSRGDL